ncbi:MAG: hypothetical protein QOK12_405, partial [Mycobacterium sp.]|nr:hypothetical protein [Mycobacterium sp.]
KQDSTTVLAPLTQVVPTTELPVATTALRIQRRPEPPSRHAAPDGPTVPAKRPFAAGAPSEPLPEVRDPDERRD